MSGENSKSKYNCNDKLLKVSFEVDFNPRFNTHNNSGARKLDCNPDEGLANYVCM